MSDTGDVLSPAEAQRMRQQLAESALVVDLLTQLPESHTQEQAIRLLVELAEELCDPAAVGFAPTGPSGSVAIVALPPTAETLTMIEAAASSLSTSRGWAQTGSGFAVSVNAGSEQLGVLAVADVASPERVEEYAKLLAIMSGPIGLAIANAQSRQVLADSERRYRLLAENATDVVWQLDADGVLVWVSPL